MSADPKPESTEGTGAPAIDWSKIMRLTGESMQDDTGRSTYQDPGDVVTGWIVLNGERLAFEGRQSSDGVMRAVLPRGLGLLAIYPDGRHEVISSAIEDVTDYSRLLPGP